MYIKKSNTALIKALAQKEYDQKILKTIDAEERRIRKFLNKYNPNSLLEVYDSMPEQKGIFVTKYELTDEEYAKMWEESKNNLGRIEPDEQLIITFLLAVAVFSSIKLTKVDAMNGKEYAKYKYYTSYQVQPGDTLTSIAQEHIKDSNVSTSDYIDEVMKNNKLSDDEITSGKKLIIAYYSYEKK